MKFFGRSLLILLALYGIVFAVGMNYLARVGAPIWAAILFSVFFIGIQYLAGPSLIEAFLDIEWDDARAELPARNIEFIERVCAERGLKVPRIGIIRSGTPNAFCFGHVPGNSRLVVSKGLLDVLTPDETNAVLAHELGHIEHWDFVVMTVAALAPLVLYQVYVLADKVEQARPVAYSAYLFYWVSQYVVLLLNRTREYFADQYSAMVTRQPATLASALVKIAYGMVRAEGEYREAMVGKSGEDKSRVQRERRIAGALGVMGISNLHAGRSLALGMANPSQAAAVMRWDLVNPWARLYELNSTHPLTAMRVLELNAEAQRMNQSVEYPLPSDQSTHWGMFPLEVILWAAPVLGAAALLLSAWAPSWLEFLGVQLPPTARPLLLFCTGCWWIIRVLFRYHGEFQSSTVASLIENVDVNQMSPIAVRLKGEIVGRGVPGAFWSPDLVLRDDTGIIFVLNRQSIPFARTLFALTSADSFIGQQVEVEGWFRRGAVPYVEMRKIQDEFGQVARSYSRWIQCAVAAVAAVIGFMWLRGF